MGGSLGFEPRKIRHGLSPSHRLHCKECCREGGGKGDTSALPLASSGSALKLALAVASCPSTSVSAEPRSLEKGRRWENSPTAEGVDLVGIPTGSGKLPATFNSWSCRLEGVFSSGPTPFPTKSKGGCGSEEPRGRFLEYTLLSLHTGADRWNEISPG